jgi:hypothetical protein
VDLSRLLRSPIVVEHVEMTGPPDEFGDPTEASTFTQYRGYVWQEAVSETSGNLVTDREVWRFALDPSAIGNVDSGDRLYDHGTVDDDGDLVTGDETQRFDVSGEPWPARNPRTQRTEYVYGRLERSK